MNIKKVVVDWILAMFGNVYIWIERHKEYPNDSNILGMNIDKDFCQANAIKYLCRYGKKNGKNRKDLLKAIHYIILLMSSEDSDLDPSPFKALENVIRGKVN